MRWVICSRDPIQAREPHHCIGVFGQAVSGAAQDVVPILTLAGRSQTFGSDAFARCHVRQHGGVAIPGPIGVGGRDQPGYERIATVVNLGVWYQAAAWSSDS